MYGFTYGLPVNWPDHPWFLDIDDGLFNSIFGFSSLGFATDRLRPPRLSQDPVGVRAASSIRPPMRWPASLPRARHPHRRSSPNPSASRARRSPGSGPGACSRQMGSRHSRSATRSIGKTSAAGIRVWSTRSRGWVAPSPCRCTSGRTAPPMPPTRIITPTCCSPAPILTRSTSSSLARSARTRRHYG